MYHGKFDIFMFFAVYLEEATNYEHYKINSFLAIEVIVLHNV